MCLVWEGGTLFGCGVLHCCWLPFPPERSMKVTSSVVQVAAVFLHTHPFFLFYVYSLYIWATSFFCVLWRFFFVIPGYVLYVMLQGSIIRLLLWMLLAAVCLTARETVEYLTVTFKYSVFFCIYFSKFVCFYILIWSKSIPVQAYYRHRRFQQVDVHRFQDIRHMEVVRLSAVPTGRLYSPGNIPGIRFR